MSTDSEQADYKELAGKIQQFLSHQIETNNSLSAEAKEGLTVATECIQEAYNFTRNEPSRELVDIYKTHKSSTSQNHQQRPSATNEQTPPGPDPAQLISNLAGTLFTQVAPTLIGAAASAAGAAFAGGAQAQSQTQQQQQQQQQPEQPAHQQQNSSTEAQPEPSAPPRPRKTATEAEKMAAESYKNQGNDLLKEEKCQEAYECYTKAIEIDDNNAVYYCNRAAALAKLGNHEGALRDCKEAIEIDPNYSKAYGRMGLSYASMENHQKAKEAYQKAVELDPTSDRYRNNLSTAEEALAAASRAPPNVGSGAAGGLGPGLQANLGPQFSNIMQSIMTNPQVINMAMRSLQDPRVLGLIGNLGRTDVPGNGAPGSGGGAAGTGAGGAPPTNNQNNGQPR